MTKTCRLISNEFTRMRVAAAEITRAKDGYQLCTAVTLDA